MVSTAQTAPSIMSFIPESYEDLYEHYYRFVLRLVSKHGIHYQNAEDVTQSILAKFWEKDALSSYDPERLGRRGTPVLFGSFLGAFVLSYLPSHWHKQHKMRGSEFTLVDEDYEIAPFLDSRGFYVEDDVSEIEMRELSNNIRARLYLAEKTNSQDKCNLLSLFNFINEYTASGEKISITALMEEFRVSKPTVQKWMKRLRSEIDSILQAA